MSRQGPRSLDRSAAVTQLLNLAPSFRSVWDNYLAYWAQEPPGACLDFGEFASFVHDAITEERRLDLPAIFDFIERCLAEGDDEVQAGASTCFLENLQNKETPPAAWVPLLGPRSMAFCQAWDAFTGVQTPGLPTASPDSP